MRLIINGTPGPVILHNGYRIPQAFGGSSFDPAFLWPERTVPRTEKPVRFDFALCHVGIHGDCRGRRDPAVCPACPLDAVCRLPRPRPLRRG